MHIAIDTDVPLDMPLIRRIVERLIQEEIWAQTVWPPGEMCLTVVLESLFPKADETFDSRSQI